MTTLSAWAFDTPEGARSALHSVERLQWRRTVVVQDASVVSWPEGSRRPESYQVGDVAGAAALAGAFWGLLFGLLFLLPLTGPDPGADPGLATRLSRIGLPEPFLQQVRAQVVPGTSALFLLVPDDATDRLAEALAGAGATELSTRLTPDQDASLRRAFDAAGPGDAPSPP